MKESGLEGARRGKTKRTTFADPQADRPDDLVQRRFCPKAPNMLWVADFTYVSTWSGWVYVAAFVIDAYARRIVGWRTATTMTSQLVLDAIEHAIWTCRREGVEDLTGLIHHHDRGSQYTSVAFTDRLVEAGIDASIGATGNSYDNALAESINGLYKPELIKAQGPWRTVDQVEVATLEWVDWFNHRRLYEHCGTCRRSSTRPSTTVTTELSPPLSSHISRSPESPGRFSPGRRHTRDARRRRCRRPR